jgi:actin related protein 2/3 complex, subunit 5
MRSVFQVLSAVKSNEIPNLIDNLEPVELDTLMKYLYRGMSNPEEFNAAVLLAW